MDSTKLKSLFGKNSEDLKRIFDGDIDIQKQFKKGGFEGFFEFCKKTERNVCVIGGGSVAIKTGISKAANKI